MRLSSWLAAFSVVVGLGAVSALAAHEQSAHPTATATTRSTVSGPLGSALLAADDPSPSNRVHAPLEYTPPPAAAPNPSGPAASGHAAPPRPVASAPSIVIGSYQQVLINRDRASRGLRPLSWSSCLASVAVANAVRLSRQGWVPPYHTNGPTVDLGCHLGNQAGENVGYWSGGINDAQLNTMFMNSPEHYANIMGPYHYVATAWAVGANGAAYIAVEFS
jgi:uncharacterized protein YkwD